MSQFQSATPLSPRRQPSSSPLAGLFRFWDTVGGLLLIGRKRHNRHWAISDARCLPQCISAPKSASAGRADIELGSANGSAPHYRKVAQNLTVWEGVPLIPHELSRGDLSRRACKHDAP
jgi:hypothetical protein